MVKLTSYKKEETQFVMTVGVKSALAPASGAMQSPLSLILLISSNRRMDTTIPDLGHLIDTWTH